MKVDALLGCRYNLVELSLHTDIYFEPEWKMKSTDLRTTLNGRKGRIRVEQDSGKESLQRRDIYICLGLYDQLCPVSVLP